MTRPVYLPLPAAAARGGLDRLTEGKDSLAANQ